MKPAIFLLLTLLLCVPLQAAPPLLDRLKDERVGGGLADLQEGALVAPVSVFAVADATLVWIQ